MRAGIILTLIVTGGLLVVAPLVADYSLRTNHQANVVRLLEKSDVNRVNLQREEIPTALYLGCWAAGAALAGTGIVLAVRELRVAAPGPAVPA
jgi:hypothetical protein